MPPRKPKPGQSLAEKRPDLAKEWSDKNEFGPEEVSCGSRLSVWWYYERNNHENKSKSTISYRV